MAKIRAHNPTIMLIFVTMTTLVLTGSAQLLPPFFPFPLPGLQPGAGPQPGAGLLPGTGGPGGGLLPSPGQIQQCLTALTSTPGCLIETIMSFFSGRLGSIGPACCNTINGLGNDCLPKLFPLNPFFPPLLRSSCSPNRGSGIAAVSKIKLPGLLPPKSARQIAECWSSVIEVEGCAFQLYDSVATGQINGISRSCCRVINRLEDKCWPHLFPYNPFFPVWLKSSCHDEADAPASAPTPTPTPASN